MTRRNKIIYWIATIWLALGMVATGAGQLIKMKAGQGGADMITHLGYPVYFIPFIGVAKVLGVIAILVPGFAKIKEWAYAGLFFDLIGATYSIISLGAPPANWMFMALPIGLGICSYFFYHKKRNLGSSIANHKYENILVRSAA